MMDIILSQQSAEPCLHDGGVRLILLNLQQRQAQHVVEAPQRQLRVIMRLI